mgnify:CR=1 FL=1
MGFFDFLKGPDINQGVKEYSTTDGAVLLAPPTNTGRGISPAVKMFLCSPLAKWLA